MKLYHCLLNVVLVSAILFPHTLLRSQEALEKEPFDKNNDGRYSEDESGIYFLHVSNAIFRKYDKSKDGKLDATELAAYGADLNEEALQPIQDGKDMVRSNVVANGGSVAAGINGDELDRYVGAKVPEPSIEPTWIRLRGRVTDFSQSADDKGMLGKLPPATLSYLRDFASNGDTWSTKGAIGGFWESNSIDFSLGAEFERIETNLASAKNVNSLIFKAIGSREITGLDDSSWLSALHYRFGVDYGTNFDFEGSVLGGVLEIEPTWEWNAFKRIAALLGDSHNIEDSFTIGMRNFLHIEGGSTVDDFPDAPAADDQYLRIGPVLEATMWPFGIKRPVSITASYGYWAEILGDADDYHNLRVGAEWRLDELGHYSLRLEYVNGVTPLLLQEQESLLLSLSVRF